MTTGRKALAALSLLFFFTTALHGGEAGISVEVWRKHREATLKHPALERYYTFEKIDKAATPIANLKGTEGSLRFGGAPADQFKLIDGRVPGKKAVRLDAGYLGGKAFAIKNKSFTVEGWFRTHGLGSKRGDSIPDGATLFSAGTGYWDGWRLTLLYPSLILGFELGRPKPVNSKGIRATESISDGVWRHAAITWDGKAMRIYADGLLIGHDAYTGNSHPPGNGTFKIGYAGAGWGSVKLDVDELAVFQRGLTSEEILRRAFFHVTVSKAVAADVAAGNKAYAGKDYQGAEKVFKRVTEKAGTHPHLRALARIGLGRCLGRQNHSHAATDQLKAVLESDQVTASQRQTAGVSLLRLLETGVGEDLPSDLFGKILATMKLSPKEAFDLRLRLARRLIREGKSERAKGFYEEALKSTDLKPMDRLKIRLELGHAYMVANAWAPARAEYEKIANEKNAPDRYKGYALIRIAESLALAKKYPDAKAALEKVRESKSLPAHFRWEAEDRGRELSRIEKGLPARDPKASRTKLPKRPAPALRLFVSPQGSDTNPGTKERPFASLKRAREALRTAKAKGIKAKGGATVVLRGGLYRIKESLMLSKEDSGTKEAPVVYTAIGDESVRISGGIDLRGFKPVNDKAILNRLPENARGKVMQLDLKAQGITKLGTVHPHGFGLPSKPAADLYFNGKPMQLARWPNKGFVKTKKVHVGGLPKDRRCAVFEYEGDRPNRWKQARDIQMYGYWCYLWAEATLGVASIDTAKRTITAAHPSPYGTKAGMPYHYLNLLEEIDQPGEWYLDRQAGKIYFYPPSDPKKATVQLSMLDGPFFELREAAFITLERLTLELGRGPGVLVSNGSDCLIAGCTLRRLGGDGILISGGKRHGVLGCDIHTLGRGGVRIAGGDRKTLKPCGHFVENCHIHHFSRHDRTYTPAVWLDGVGSLVRHNLFHDTSCHGMRVNGNDHLIEFNEIHHTVLESDDQGGLDMWGNPTYRGNVIRYNYWHDIGKGTPKCGQAGVRLDDAICGTVIYGNFFQRCSRGHFGGVQVHGGKENWIDNNVFVDCKYAVSFSRWGRNRWFKFLAERGVAQTTKEVDIRKPPYATRYPDLARLGRDPDVNHVWRNLVFRCAGLFRNDGRIQDLLSNTVTREDPGFMDVKRNDFRLKAGAEFCRRTGFRPIPFDEIGLYTDTYRSAPNKGE